MTRRAVKAIGLAFVASCSAAEAETPAAAPARLATKHLPNAVRVTPGVISGGLPQGDAAFAELASLGVRTVISVDGQRPDVAAAGRHGLRYVHLPHGYDGVPPRRALELAKAVQELEGPIYLHCHHGKHRSPAAAAVACVTAGRLDSVDGRRLLDIAGTSPHYVGLFRSVEGARPVDPVRLARMHAEFPEVAAIPPIAQAMVDLEATHERLLAIAAAGWRPPQDHPDLDPAHEALLLREHYAELLRQEETRSQTAAFRNALEASHRLAAALEGALAEPRPEGVAEANRRLERVTVDCRACHERFRDPPREAW